MHANVGAIGVARLVSRALNGFGLELIEGITFLYMTSLPIFMFAHSYVNTYCITYSLSSSILSNILLFYVLTIRWVEIYDFFLWQPLWELFK